MFTLKRAHGDGVGQSAKRLFLDLNLGFLVHLNRCIDGIGSHAPQLARTRELRSVDRDLMLCSESDGLSTAMRGSCDPRSKRR
jgi:hypothetical protein